MQHARWGLPPVLLTKVPDGAPSNSRKLQQSEDDLPANIGMLASKCGTHTAQRVIEGRITQTWYKC